jgi:sulfoxide reductase heme-binding subunit YedZ
MTKKFDWLRIAVHLGALVTLAVFVIRYLTKTLSINPNLTLEQQTGKTALIFLVLSLACSPIGSILDWKNLSKRKKALGLYGFMFAAIHVLVYVGLDYGFQIGLVVQAVLFSVYLWFGLAAILLLLPLAITSFKKMKQLLKKNWKRLHRLVYIITPIVIVHFFLSLKGNILRLQGDIKQPLLYSIIVLILLVMRIPFIKRALINLRVNLQIRLSKSNPV